MCCGSHTTIKSSSDQWVNAFFRKWAQACNLMQHNFGQRGCNDQWLQSGDMQDLAPRLLCNPFYPRCWPKRCINCVCLIKGLDVDGHICTTRMALCQECLCSWVHVQTLLNEWLDSGLCHSSGGVHIEHTCRWVKQRWAWSLGALRNRSFLHFMLQSEGMCRVPGCTFLSEDLAFQTLDPFEFDSWSSVSCMSFKASDLTLFVWHPGC